MSVQIAYLVRLEGVHDVPMRITARSAADAAETLVTRQCCKDIVWRSHIAIVRRAGTPATADQAYRVNVTRTPIFKATPIPKGEQPHG